MPGIAKVRKVDAVYIIKDISAAATGIAILVWLLVMVYEYYHIYRQFV